MPDPIRQANTPDRSPVFRWFFFGAFLYLAYQLLQILSPFTTALTGAVTLTLIFFPVHARIRRWIRHADIAAMVSTFLASIIILVPLGLFLWLMVKEAAEAVPSAQAAIAALGEKSNSDLSLMLPPTLRNVWRKLEYHVGLWQLDLRTFFLTATHQIGNAIAGVGANFLRDIVHVIADAAVLVFVSFFFFRDGGRIVRWLVDLTPMPQKDTELVIARLDETLSAVVRGVFITAAAQGLLAGLAYVVLGIRFPVLLSFATAFMALIPVAGAMFVWFPVVLVLLLTGATYKALALFVWGAFAVGLIDNLLRPALISEQAHLPVLLLFLGMLGGVQVYGFVGVLIGPLVIASVLAFARIYQEQYQVLARDREPPSPTPKDA